MINISELLNKNENDYIFSLCNIENHNTNSDTKFRIWFNHFIKNHKIIKGDLFEFGVYRGNSLISMAILMKRLNSKKKIYGFDSFTGFPNYCKYDNFSQFKNNKNLFDKKILENVEIFKKLNIELGNQLTINKISSSKNFANTSYKYVKSLIRLFNLDNIVLIKGDFSKTVPIFFKNYKNKIFSANIDCDLYNGYKICLPYLWKNLSKKGLIYLDEYYSLKFPGPRIACNEFFKKNNIKSLKITKTKNKFDRCYLIK
tara:strand:+ start:2372 stop:3142 length:771 start_codon:yes stop_codon:yes gene_type:complete